MDVKITFFKSAGISKINVAHQVRVQVEGCRQVTSIVLLCRPTVHHKETDAILKGKKKSLSRYLLSFDLPG